MAEKHKLHNVRLDDEVWAAVKAMDCSLNQYLRGLLLDKDSEYNPPAPTVPHVGRLHVSPRTYSDPREIPGVSVGASTSLEGQFRCRCVHTGCKGSYFLGSSKFQTLCDVCLGLGHSGDPRSCKICYEDSGPA